MTENTETEPEVRDFRVRDTDREFRFRGRFLGFASTEERGGDRWIEFTIYRTEKSGKYVMSRVGRSDRFHTPTCFVVGKNPDLRPVALATLSESAEPCAECMPNGDDDLDDNAQVYPEQDRTWAGTFDTANDLIEGLMQTSENGSHFLTHIAREVLKASAVHDKTLRDAYYIEEIS